MPQPTCRNRTAPGFPSSCSSDKHTNSISCYLCTPFYSALYPARLFSKFSATVNMIYSLHAPLATEIRLSHETPLYQTITPIWLHSTHFSLYSVSHTGGVAAGYTQHAARASRSLLSHPLLPSRHTRSRQLLAPPHFLRSAPRYKRAPITRFVHLACSCAMVSLSRSILQYSTFSLATLPVECAAVQGYATLVSLRYLLCLLAVRDY